MVFVGMTRRTEMRLRHNLPFRRDLGYGRGKLVGIRDRWKLLNERADSSVQSENKAMHQEPCPIPANPQRCSSCFQPWHRSPENLGLTVPSVMIGSSSRQRAVFRLALESMPELTGDCTSFY